MNVRLFAQCSCSIFCNSVNIISTSLITAQTINERTVFFPPDCFYRTVFSGPFLPGPFLPARESYRWSIIYTVHYTLSLSASDSFTTMALYKCIYFTYSHRHGRKHCVRTVVCSLVFANTIKLWVFLPTQVTTPGSKRSPKYRAASFGGHLPLRNVTGPASQNNKPHLAGNAGLNL